MHMAPNQVPVARQGALQLTNIRSETLESLEIGGDHEFYDLVPRSLPVVKKVSESMKNGCPDLNYRIENINVCS